MKIQRIDHVGVIVRDLAAARAFFVDLGLERSGKETGWKARGQIVRLDGVKATMGDAPDARRRGQYRVHLVLFAGR